jgi:hypothetical protein
MRLSFLLLSLTAVTSWAADVTIRPALNFSKSFGGSGTDTGSSVAVDADGNIYIAGSTNSPDFPIASAIQPKIGGTTLRSSIDSGKTWSAPVIPDPVYAVAGSPKAPATLFAGTINGIYKSGDSGQTWNLLSGAGNVSVEALVADAETPSTVYCATTKGMLKSVDSGVTWNPTGPAGLVLALVANPAQPGSLIAAMNLTNKPSLYRTTDAGATWTLLANSPLGPFAIAFDITNPNVVYLGASTTGFSSGGVTSIYKSVDNGDSWSKLSGPSPVLSTFMIAAGAGQLYVGTRNGLQLSGDGGLTWKAATGVKGSVGNVTVDPARPQTVYAAGDGIFASNDAGASWSKVSPLRQNVETIAVAPTAPSSTLFVGASLGSNAFITKWSGDGSRMIYSTYLGGSNTDLITGMVVDRQGSVYVAGSTSSTDFPVTADAMQPSNNGSINAFLSKISGDGKTLLYSTYLGGTAADGAGALAVDAAGNAYLTGAAGSPDFPVTAGALQRYPQKTCSVTAPNFQATVSTAFVSKIATVGAGLRYSTLLGGSCPDEAYAIAIDAAGSAYVAGVTASADFPVTQGALQPKYPGGSFAGFLTKLTPSGTGMAYSTFLGGAGHDAAIGVTVDSKGAAYVTGSTWGFDQRIAGLESATPTAAALMANANGLGFGVFLGGAAFVLKVDATGSNRIFLKYLGGTSGYAVMLALDPTGNLWVAGNTSPFVE